MMDKVKMTSAAVRRLFHHGTCFSRLVVDRRNSEFGNVEQRMGGHAIGRGAKRKLFAKCSGLWGMNRDKVKKTNTA